MVAKGIQDVRAAVPCDLKRLWIASNGIFHEQAGIVEDKAGQRLAWNGSLNETVNGWQEDWERKNDFKSWEMDSQRVDEEEKNFSSIWATFSLRLITLDVTAAIGQNLMHFLPDDDKPTRQEKADVVENPIKTPASLDSDGLGGVGGNHA